MSDRKDGPLLTRRRFVAAAASGLAAAHLRAEGPPPAPRGKAEHCLFLWLGGGMAHLDTFDPKRRGDPKRQRAGSYYGAIDTAVRGVRVCEHLQRVAPLL